MRNPRNEREAHAIMIATRTHYRANYTPPARRAGRATLAHVVVTLACVAAIGAMLAC